MIRRSLQTLAVLLVLVGAFLGAGANPAAAELSTPDAVVALIAENLDAFYAEWLGADYRSPVAVYYYNTGDDPGSVFSACGTIGTDNAAYCPADESIYLDYTFLWALLEDGGDYAVGYALAHEWSHHVQQIYGIPGTVYTIELELQADCLAGLFSRRLADLGILEVGDLEEGLALAFAGGDPVGTDPLHQDAHGDGQTRMEWFAYGYDTYDWDACETY